MRDWAKTVWREVPRLSPSQDIALEYLFGALWGAYVLWAVLYPLRGASEGRLSARRFVPTGSHFFVCCCVTVVLGLYFAVLVVLPTLAGVRLYRPEGKAALGGAAGINIVMLVRRGFQLLFSRAEGTARK